MGSIFLKRFSELAMQMDGVACTVKVRANAFGTGGIERYLDGPAFLNWKVKARNLLGQACGPESVHVQQFTAAYGHQFEDSEQNFLFLKAIFEAAREDFEGGYLATVRGLVRAEVFASELEQAEELYRGGYHVAAAVIAGTVLETSIGSLCDQHGVARTKLSRMNDDLVKAGAYNALEHKSVTAMAAIRNAAAHGKSSEFTEAQVGAMLGDVGRFATAHSES
jgi:hypothetical protein